MLAISAKQLPRAAEAAAHGKTVEPPLRYHCRQRVGVEGDVAEVGDHKSRKPCMKVLALTDIDDTLHWPVTALRVDSHRGHLDTITLDGFKLAKPCPKSLSQQYFTGTSLRL